MLKGKWWLIFALTHFSIILVFFLFHLYFFKDVSEPCGVSIILRRACDVTNASRRVGNHLLNILVRQKSTTIINDEPFFKKNKELLKETKIFLEEFHFVQEIIIEKYCFGLQLQVVPELFLITTIFLISNLWTTRESYQSHD